MTKRLTIALLTFCAFLVLWLLLEIFAPPVQAAELRINLRQDVPTVSGIEAAPSPLPFYRPQIRVNSGPSAGVYYLDAPAPPNGCPEPAFRVISGPQSGRGCVGHP